MMLLRKYIILRAKLMPISVKFGMRLCRCYHVNFFMWPGMTADGGHYFDHRWTFLDNTKQLSNPMRHNNRGVKSAPGALAFPNKSCADAIVPFAGVLPGLLSTAVRQV